jgi:hypothetical protein
VSRLHRSDPYDVVHHPQLEPEVKRAVHASWASDRVRGRVGATQGAGSTPPVSVDDVVAALKALDGANGERRH